MAYFDAFVIAVPTANREAFRAQAAAFAPYFLRHGALRCTENWADDVPHGEVTDFYRSVAAKDDETVVVSFLEWPDKATRDAGMKAVSAEMETAMKDHSMPFDGKRMIYGGFEPIVDERA
ncbi:DUF1428 domain-containing protein [Pararhizobium mangrovi]|uniref:DUF1428 domain-containing protein n=1 Tax=Pararhizobium mangrovi TaxID=2590452 RepID=A0A506TYP9_9HYPH|nr:DUF1428 family protein [Pararhizobium mangrovi]TPW26446.1 DUF1428 domain-containing protein [Pararhizobium mangrovi]